MGDRWAGAWQRPADESKYVWLPLTFPSVTTLSMSWYPKLSIDSRAGTITGVPFLVNSGVSYELLNRISEKALNIRDFDEWRERRTMDRQQLAERALASD